MANRNVRSFLQQNGKTSRSPCFQHENVGEDTRY